MPEERGTCRCGQDCMTELSVERGSKTAAWQIESRVKRAQTARHCRSNPNLSNKPPDPENRFRMASRPLSNGTMNLAPAESRVSTNRRMDSK